MFAKGSTLLSVDTVSLDEERTEWTSPTSTLLESPLYAYYKGIEYHVLQSDNARKQDVLIQLNLICHQELMQRQQSMMEMVWWLSCLLIISCWSGTRTSERDCPRCFCWYNFQNEDRDNRCNFRYFCFRPIDHQFLHIIQIVFYLVTLLYICTKCLMSS